jgi:hypothetical protein
MLTDTCIGLRDLNYARQNVTERYVRQCDQVFAIARIGRATSDTGVEEVFKLARQALLPNVAVICTQSDVSGLSRTNHYNINNTLEGYCTEPGKKGLAP